MRTMLRETVIVVGMALVLSLIVKTWLLQAFYIPSGSMEDTLRQGRPGDRQQADPRTVRPPPR